MTGKQSIAIVGANSILAQSIFSRLYNEYNVIQVYHIHDDKILNKENLVHVDDFIKMNASFKAIYFISSVINFEESGAVVQKIFDTNIKLLVRVSEQFPAAQLIHASSVSVFAQQDGVITENSPVSPASSYAMSKLWAEQIVNNHEGGGVNIRVSSLFGVQMNQSTFLPKIIRDAIKKKQITLFGDGARKQNYISAGEASEYFYKAIEFSGKIPLLAVGQESISNIDVARIIKEELDNISLKFSGEDRSKSFVYRNTITKELLHINTSYSFSHSLNEVIQWMQKQS